MPIRASLRWFYPIDGPQLSREIRFDRARGRCETCSRRHGTKELCLPDGRWFDRDETAGVTATETGAFRHGAPPSTSCA